MALIKPAKRALILGLLAVLASSSLQISCAAQESPSVMGETAKPAKSAEASGGRVTVVAPMSLRPRSDYIVLVTVADSQAPASVELQLTGARDSNREQVEARSVLVQSGETQTVKFAVGDWPAAEYILGVNAQAVDRSWQFQKEAPVNFHAKSYTGLIQTDKPLYKPGELVKFRVIFLSESLAPLPMKDEIKVTVSDPQRNLIRQWTSLSNWRGLLTLELALSDEPMLGDWTIGVEARGQQFSKQFSVAEYIVPTFDVQIQLPPYATYNDSQVSATVRASYTYGKPVRGHVTLSVQPLVRFTQIDARPLEQAQHRARLQDGSADFKIDLSKQLRQQADLFEREIEFFALVEEDLTGRQYNRSAIMKVHSKPVKIERVHADAPFKPGLSHLLQYKVAYQDDTPVEEHGQPVVLQYSVLGRRLAEFKLRPSAGLIEHDLEVPAELRRPALHTLGHVLESETTSGELVRSRRELIPSQIDVRAQYRGQTHYLRSLNGAHSASNQYMQLSLPQLQQRAASKQHAQANVNDKLKVRVKSTERMQRINCQGLARGSVIWALSPDAHNKSELEFEVQVEQRMAPETRVLCFYLRPDNHELISDAIDVPVSGLMRNFVKLAPSRSEAKPGQQLDVDAFTKPGALIGVLAIDQSVLLLKSGNDLSISQLHDENKRFESASSSPVGLPKNELSATTTAELFDQSNLLIITNNLIEDQRVFPLMMKAAFGSPSASSIQLDKLVLEHEIQPPEFHLGDERKSGEQIVIRREFPETWLWQNGTADSNGKLKFSAKIPDSITTWQLSAFSLSEAHGFGLADTKSPTTIRVFRPFFIKLNLPYSIIRGETVSVQAIVFNYSKKPTAAKVTLDNARGEFEFVEAANTLDEEKRSNKTSESRLVRVPANEGASVSFLVRPFKVGSLDVKMIAQGEQAGDGLVRKLLVKPEGQAQHFNRAMLIRLPRSESTEPFVRNVSIEVPANAVRDSKRVHVSAVGDILGAGLSNLDDLLRLPYGCGEQNMINLVPNIVIHNYLTSTGRLRDAQRQRAKRNIETGYQRQLNYKRVDGSFSAFGQADANGSVWLTAYVLRTLQQARSIISVDSQVIQQAANFVARFARPDGSFEEVGMLHHKQLASASADESSCYLTAYTLCALFEGPLETDSSSSSSNNNNNNDNNNNNNSSTGNNTADENKRVIERGLGFLERQLERTDSAYDLAIVANAMQLAGRKQAADRAYDKLWARVNESQDQAWWTVPRAAAKNSSASANLRAEPEEFAVEPSKPTSPPLKPLPVDSKQSAHLFAPDGLAVEATSWALLAAVRRGDLERALPAVRWLISQQNSQGGYASTQDTVLAIEALAAFAQASGQSQAAPNISIDLVYPSAKRSSQLRRTESDQLNIGQTNALVQQQLQLPDNSSWIHIHASGTGVAVVQVSWQYNLLVSAEEPAFYLNPIIDKVSTINYLQLSVCTYYKAGEASNMAVVEIELPSGYVADAEALPGLKRHKSIKRVDTTDGETKAIVYLDRVTRSEELCFTVPAHRSTRVSNNKPVPVTIYDYYDRQQAARIFYEPQPASSCDICEPDTCSEQCSSKPKPTSKLISLHEQRRLSGQLRQEPQKTLIK